MSIAIKEKEVRGVIFDVDGVLLDSMKIWTDLGARYLRHLGILPEDGLNQILFSMSMEQGADYLREHYNIGKNSTEILNGISRMIEDFYFYEVVSKPGAGDIMERFRTEGIPMTAATSSPREHVVRALKRNGLLAYLDKIFTTSEVGESKHSPRIYDIASQSMGLNRGETLVFEDSLYALMTAKRAGYITAGVYDEDGEKDKEGVKSVGDIYLINYKDFPWNE